MNITVTLTAHPEFLSVLQSLVGALANSTESVKQSAKKTNGTKMPESTTPITAPVQTSEVNISTDKTPSEKAISITIEQIRAAVQKQSGEGKRDQIKALLAEFGADKVTNLTKDQYADFLSRLEKL